jgi:branched-chain amino acid transport system permease protein
MNICIKSAYFAVAALGLNIIVGYCGLLNLGFAGFMLIGAYTGGILTKQYHLSFWTAATLSIIHGAIWGILLGLPTLRLTGDYFAIVTFGFAELVNMAAKNWVSLTRGPRGYPDIPSPSLDFSWLHSMGLFPSHALKFQFLSTTSPGKVAFWYLAALMLGLVMFFCDRLSRSRLGRAWSALREDEVAAEACGINAMWYKTVAFAISAGIGALSGAFESSYSTMADFHNYEFMVSVSVLAYLVLGGMGTVRGSVLGAFILVALGELLRVSPAVYLAHGFTWWPAAHSWLIGLPWVPDMRMIFYGVILVLMIRFRPEGLLPGKARARELHGTSREKARQSASLFSMKIEG